MKIHTLIMMITILALSAVAYGQSELKAEVVSNAPAWPEVEPAIPGRSQPAMARRYEITL